MKKLLFSLAALGVATFGFAQNKANFSPATKGELTKISQKTDSYQYNKGAAFFVEDFANGLMGNNGVGEWTSEDSESYGIWHINTPASPEGEFSTNIGPLASTSAANGWMIFDADGFNTVVNETGTTGIASDLQGFLTTPSIDMTAEPSVILEFQQYFRYCCFGTSPMSVDQIRWAYNSEFNSGYSHYYWGIDDVSIFGNANTNDIAIDLVTNGDIWNLYEFRVLPMEQVIAPADGGVLVGTYYQNYGTANQSNVTVKVEILDDAGTVLSTTESAPFNMLSFANSAVCPAQTDSMYMETGWAPDAPGVYTIRSTVASADATDDTPDNNVVLKTIEYTTLTMGHDDASNFDLELRQSEDDGTFQTEGFGNHYQMNNEGSDIYGIVASFGPNTTPGLTIEARLYNTDNGFIDVANPYAFIDYEIEADDVPSSMENPIATFIEFQGTEPVDVGETYFGAVVVPEDGEGELSVMSNANSDSDFSTGEIDLSGGGDYVWFNRPDVPAVRLAFGEIVGIEELNLIDGVASINNMPNPVNDLTTINFTLVDALEVSIEIVDITGKVIFSENQGTRAAGAHQVQIDASAYADGVYFYSLISGDQRMTRKMVVTK